MEDFERNRAAVSSATGGAEQARAAISSATGHFVRQHGDFEGPVGTKLQGPKSAREGSRPEREP